MRILIVHEAILEPHLRVAVAALRGLPLGFDINERSDQVELDIGYDPIVKLKMRSCAGGRVLVLRILCGDVKLYPHACNPRAPGRR